MGVEVTGRSYTEMIQLPNLLHRSTLPSDASSLVKVSVLMDYMFSLDDYLTTCVGVCARPKTPWQRALKACCVCLELSGHGVPWFALAGLLLILSSFVDNSVFYTYGLNMLTLLILDIALVAPLKLYFRRDRPSLNQGNIPMSVSSVDTYSFPSGHASRCVALAAYFCYFCYVPPFLLRTHLWYIWAAIVSLSRILIGRHHISDVCVGMLVGLAVFEMTRRLGLLYDVPS